jgi:drug/metabolite transporter (DMT)-like permease
MNLSAHSHDRRAEFLLLGLVFVWAANFPVMKFALIGIPLLVFNSIRFVVGASVLGAAFASRSKWVPFERTELWKVVGIGLLAHFVYQMVFIVGLTLTTAGNSAVLVSTAPLWTVFFDSRLHKTPISRHMWIGMGVSFAGVILIVIGSGKKLEFGSAALVGDIITLAAASLWGLYTNLQKHLLARHSAVQLTFSMVTMGAIGLTLIGIPSIASVNWGSIPWPYYLAAIASGALSIGFANAVWSYGVKRLGPGRTSAFNNLVPVLAFIISYLALDEKIYAIQVVGAAITISGVWLARKRVSQEVQP